MKDLCAPLRSGDGVVRADFFDECLQAQNVAAKPISAIFVVLRLTAWTESLGKLQTGQRRSVLLCFECRCGDVTTHNRSAPGIVPSRQERLLCFLRPEQCNELPRSGFQLFTRQF
jgi:hypothetical protein